MVDRGTAEALHEKASQHYLSGEFAEALAAWEAVLRLDPADERALEGTRLSRLMVPEPESAPEFHIDHETADRAAVQTAAPARAAAVLPDPSRQAEGIDFGDLSGVPDLSLDRAAEDAIDAALGGAPQAPAASGGGSLADLLSMQIEAVVQPDEPEVAESGIAPFQSAAPPAARASAPPPAAGELSRRLAELLEQAEAATDAGNLDEARALLARIAVLDEDNAAAQALQEKLQARETEGLRQIDDWIVEGVQLFEHGRHAEARANFERVLERMPDHLEAQDYMRRIREASAPRNPVAQPEAAPPLEEDFLASLTSSAPEPTLTGVPLAVPSPRARTAGPAAPVAAPVADLAPAARRRLSPVLLVGGLAVVAAAGWFFLGPKEEGSDIPESAITGKGAPSSETRAAPPAPPAPPASPAPAPSSALAVLSAPPPAASDPHVRVETAVAKKDWSAAIVAYNEILAAKPDDVVARAGLMEAAQHYREQKALSEQMEQARRAFADAEYEAALRLLYRMPEGVDTAAVEQAKVAGWYNLAIVSLKAGEPEKALQHTAEALSVNAEDQGVRQLQAFAQDRVGKAKDQAYYARVEAMEFRSLPE